MTMPYIGFGSRAQATPQTELIPGSNQVPNNAGGFGWQADDLARFQRFLILGSAGGTAYIGARELTRQNLECLERLMQAGCGSECVDLIVEISQAGRAVSNDPALFALARLCACDVHGKITQQVPAEKTYELHRCHHEALFASFPQEGVPQLRRDGRESWVRRGDILYRTIRREVATTVQVDHPFDVAVRQYAYAVLPKVARTGTHLFHFMEYVKQFRGRGASHRRALKAWYTAKQAERLAYQLVKYQSRDGWSQRDVLRLSHPKPPTEVHSLLYRWSVKGLAGISDFTEEHSPLIYGVEQAKRAETDTEVAALIRQFRLPREAVPTEHLKSVRVWEALLEEMPLEAMTRNLATMTRNGLLAPMGTFTQEVVNRLTNQERIREARLHPIKLLAAMLTYASGKSVIGKATWVPLRKIVDALDTAFYLAFQYAEPTGKRLLIAVDVSSSMHGTPVGMVQMKQVGNLRGLEHKATIPGLSAHQAAAALALVAANREPNWHLMAFDTRAFACTISPSQGLDDVARQFAGLGGGGTDCALPFLYALERRMDVEAFLVLSDNETWAGKMHPAQALAAYRRQVGHPVKVVNVQMAPNHTTVADPADPDALEIVGFDADAPGMVEAFLREMPGSKSERAA